MVSALFTLAVIMVVLAVLIGALSFMGLLVGLVFKLLPVVLVVAAVAFFVKGGRIRVHVDFDDNDD